MTISETPDQHWQELTARLKQHPELSERIERLLEIVENADGDSLTADAVEGRVVADVRRIGHDALQGWAVCKAKHLEDEYGRCAGFEWRGKNSTGRRASESVNTFDGMKQAPPAAGLC